MSSVGADCPNCNLKIDKAPVIEEQEAIDQLDNVLNLLDSNSVIQSSAAQINDHDLEDMDQRANNIQDSPRINNDAMRSASIYQPQSIDQYAQNPQSVIHNTGSVGSSNMYPKLNNLQQQVQNAYADDNQVISAINN